MARRRSGFTLIELLVVVAIIGIIVAISVLNYINAIQRARQKRTMADIRGIGIAVDSYNIDLNTFPPAAATTLPAGLSLPTLTLGNMANYVSPTYVQVVPLSDGWNSWFTYGTNTEGKDFIIRSSGADGVPETTPVYGPTTAYKQDIIYVDGAFLQYPEGAQQ